MLVYVLYSRSGKKLNFNIYNNTNYLTEMKLVQIIMDYCLLQFDGLIFWGGHGFLCNCESLWRVLPFLKICPNISETPCIILYTHM